jgi:hypothetical protein
LNIPINPTCLISLTNRSDPSISNKRTDLIGPFAYPLPASPRQITTPYLSEFTQPLTARNYVSWEPNGTMHYGPVNGGWRVSAWAERVGKKAAGRLLDGREWNEVPK